MESSAIRYVSNDSGEVVAVLVPIDLWREIASERETAYLLASAAMAKRLTDARGTGESISMEDVRAKFGFYGGPNLDRRV